MANELDMSLLFLIFLKCCSETKALKGYIDVGSAIAWSEPVSISLHLSNRMGPRDKGAVGIRMNIVRDDQARACEVLKNLARQGRSN